MQRLIAIALSLLCIALPLQAGANALMGNQHCPMMSAKMQAAAQDTVQSTVSLSTHHTTHPEQAHAQAQVAEMPAAHTASSDGHDCCNDADAFARTGQMCKSGQMCSPSLAYLLPLAAVLSPMAIHHPALTAASTPLQTRPPGAVWRPPSLS
jgi:hypothetical protein